jgi:hypothetical protein
VTTDTGRHAGPAGPERSVGDRDAPPKFAEPELPEASQPGGATVHWKRWLVAICAAGAIVGVALYATRDVVGGLVARGARDLLLLSAPHAYLSAIEWAEGSFWVRSPFLPVPLAVGIPGFWLFLGIPVGFALSLPGVPDRVWRAGMVLIVSFIACWIAVAIAVEEALGTTLEQLGLMVLPPWRAQGLRAACRSICVALPVAYPLIACSWIASRNLTSRNHLQFRELALPRRRIRRIFALAALALAWVTLDIWAGRIIPTSPLTLRDYQAFEAWSPDLSGHLLRRGEIDHEAELYQRAAQSFWLALEHERYQRPSMHKVRRLARSKQHPAALGLLRALAARDARDARRKTTPDESARPRTREITREK